MTELTKYGTNNNYRIPPQSTGARVAHHEHWYFKVNGLDNHFTTPSSYTLGSGIHGVVVAKDAFEGGHRLLVTAHRSSPLSGFIVDDVFTLTDTGGTFTGTLKEFDAVLLPQTSIVDAQKPDRHLSIDPLGAASVRFTEGEPTFDPYGLIRMSQLTRLADYVFRYSTNSTNWQQKTAANGTLTHIPSQSSIALDVGTGATDLITYTTNRAHRYNPGVAHLATMSIHLGDTAKDGCVRRWGLFNDKNGIFFEYDNDTLCAVIRSNVTGQVVDTRVPQHLWEVDVLDGSGTEANRSRMNLDVSKQNVYWFDFQWHGAGVVRFGTFTSEGKRTVAHQVQNANKLAGPYTETATLPFRISIENKKITASPSRLVLTACALFREGQSSSDAQNNNAVVRSYTITPKTVNGNTYVCVGAFRAAGTIGGVPNYKAIIPRALNYYCDKDVSIMIKGGTVFNGAETWTSAALGSGAEVCENGVALFDGIQASAIYMNAGAHAQPVSDTFNSLGQNLHSMADATAGSMYTTWVKCLNPADTGTFHLTLDWVEI